MDVSRSSPGPGLVEQRLHESELRYRRLFESAKDGILILDAVTGMVVDVNPFLLGLLGYSREAFLGKKVWELGFLADLVASEARFAELQSKEYVRYDDIPLRASDGHCVDVEVISNVYLVNGERVMQCNVRDVSERKRQQATMRLQSAALNAAASSIIITDRDGTLEWANAAFASSSGYRVDEAVGRNLRELVKSGAHSRDFYEQMWKTILAGEVWRGELTNRRKNGSVHPEEVVITPVLDAKGACSHFIAIKRDLTEEKRKEAAFLQAQKMESVGQLAGGVAHDFNNILTVINGTAALATEDLRPGDPLRESLADILSAGQRAAALTRQLLAFSRRQVLQPAVVKMDAIVVNVEKMLRRLIGERVSLAVVSHPELGSVRADPGQLEQVIVNLVVNARDALPDGGSIQVETCNVVIAADESQSEAPASPGPYVQLSVRDTGMGMSFETQERIFEPFFTTKEIGHGTGLGLSTVYGIVKQSGGSVTVESAIGQGSTFKILFPRVPDEAAKAAPASRRVERGDETILVVEDDENLLRVVDQILTRAGYQVLKARDGIDALDVLQLHGARVRLVVSDAMMPRMGGIELGTRLSSSHPGLPVILTTGYAKEQAAEFANNLSRRDTYFIAKPYNPIELTRLVRDALDAPGAARRS